MAADQPSFAPKQPVRFEERTEAGNTVTIWSARMFGDTHGKLYVTDQTTGIPFLVDTGSMCSLVPFMGEDIAGHTRAQYTESLPATCGSHIQIHKMKAMTIKLENGVEIDHEFKVHNGEAILGFDFLFLNHMEIDVVNKALIRLPGGPLRSPPLHFRIRFKVDHPLLEVTTGVFDTGASNSFVTIAALRNGLPANCRRLAGNNVVDAAGGRQGVFNPLTLPVDFHGTSGKYVAPVEFYIIDIARPFLLFGFETMRRYFNKIDVRENTYHIKDWPTYNFIDEIKVVPQ